VSQVAAQSSEALAAIEEDLHRLETGLRQLKIQYDMFFAGGAKREPFELRWRIDKLVRRYSEKPLRNYALRFRFTGLVSRYNSLVERWTKQMRENEEGSRRHGGMLDQFHIRERILARVVVGDDQDEDVAGLRRLHEQYVQEQRRHGVEAPPSFDGFARTLRDKARKLRERVGCAGIEMRVVVRNDEVRLKARPVR
jgi:hypothetical protein